MVRKQNKHQPLDPSVHRLIVKRVQSSNVAGYKFLYTLGTNTRKKYYSLANKKYPIGAVLLCSVKTADGPDGEVFFTRINNDPSSTFTTMSGGNPVLLRDYSAPSAPDKAETSGQEPKPENPKIKKPEIEDKVKLSPLHKRYRRDKRYFFVVTNKRNSLGNQIVADRSGREHLLTNTTTEYPVGATVCCTVIGFSWNLNATNEGEYLILSSPRIVPPKEETTNTGRATYIKSPIWWHAEVQDLGKHKCGKPFVCNCCGGSFPANAGVRVDLKDIYFCNSCAKLIYDPKDRGSSRFYISTPMGNKR